MDLNKKVINNFMLSTFFFVLFFARSGLLIGFALSGIPTLVDLRSLKKYQCLKWGKVHNNRKIKPEVIFVSAIWPFDERKLTFNTTATYCYFSQKMLYLTMVELRKATLACFDAFFIVFHGNIPFLCFCKATRELHQI